MAGKIPQNFIDELINRVDIVDIVDSRVPLKKAGRDYTACCPFHNEKTPSFTVSQTKQFYHCFGCGAHGTAIGFLMEYEHMGFVEAVEELADLTNLEVPREASTASHPHDSESPGLYAIMERAADYYRNQLRDHPEAPRAINYLKGRGLSGEIAAEFGIGFAPPGWDNLIQALDRDDTSKRQLLRSGMTIEKENHGAYDRFRDRIMFPIRDRRGRTIAFGGRILGTDEAQAGAKYLNSPETPIFHKGRELYGLYEARKALRQPRQLMVVEGYMDVVALAQFEIRYAVATLGTATTHEHLEALYRVVPEVIFCFDGDRAGREAAWRALENTLPVMRDGRQARFLLLPDGEDPDTLVRKEGKEALEQRLAEAPPLSEFFFSTLSSRVDMETAEGRARLVAQAKPLLDKLPENVFKHMMLTRLAKLAGVPLEQMGIPLPAGRARQGQSPAPRPSARASRKHPGSRPMRMAISLLLNRPALASQTGDLQALRQLDLPGIQILTQLLEILGQQPHLTTAGLIENWRDTPEEKHLSKLAQQEIPGKEDDIAQEFKDTLKKLQLIAREQRRDILQQKLARNDISNDEIIEWNQLVMKKEPCNEEITPPGN